MQFHYFGNKGVLQLCLRFDLCHPKANATIFTQFLRAYDQQLNSSEHKEAQKKAEARDDKHGRLSRQIFQIRMKIKEGDRLSILLANGKLQWSDLSPEQEELVDQCASGFHHGKDFISTLRMQEAKLLKQREAKRQKQQEPRDKKYEAGSAAFRYMQEVQQLKSGDPYIPEAKSFNLSGKGKGKRKGMTTKTSRLHPYR